MKQIVILYLITGKIQEAIFGLEWRFNRILETEKSEFSLYK